MYFYKLFNSNNTQNTDVIKQNHMVKYFILNIVNKLMKILYLPILI